LSNELKEKSMESVKNLNNEFKENRKLRCIRNALEIAMIFTENVKPLMAISIFSIICRKETFIISIIKKL